ncbi:hypothetical protein [Bacillus sp. FJAT-27445]|uniref:hypothetical protein n=1 Tax=Bacillus sp. FJAT-27445 TaxID=1679166 RepID=UPI00074418F4|nr:hypothetical protein [Bacillus sp. FJAT-27445]
MKKISFAIIFLVIILFGCQSNDNDLTFDGESEIWSARVTVNQSNGEEKYQIQLNYKGNNIEGIDTFHYQVESNNNGNIDFGADNAKLNKEGIYFNKSLGSNSPTASSDDELVIKIEWNDTSDSFTLVTK